MKSPRTFVESLVILSSRVRIKVRVRIIVRQGKKFRVGGGFFSITEFQWLEMAC